MCNQISCESETFVVVQGKIETTFWPELKLQLMLSVHYYLMRCNNILMLYLVVAKTTFKQQSGNSMAHSIQGIEFCLQVTKLSKETSCIAKMNQFQ